MESRGEIRGERKKRRTNLSDVQRGGGNNGRNRDIQRGRGREGEQERRGEERGKCVFVSESVPMWR